MSKILSKKVTLFYYNVVSMRDTKCSSPSQPHFWYSYCEEQLSNKTVSCLLVGIYLITNRSSTGYQKLTNSIKIQQAQVWSCVKRNYFVLLSSPCFFSLNCTLISDLNQPAILGFTTLALSLTSHNLILSPLCSKQDFWRVGNVAKYALVIAISHLCKLSYSTPFSSVWDCRLNREV